jgi:monofunctional biosynthetic peptidoglycan transglycosylase
MTTQTSPLFSSIPDSPPKNKLKIVISISSVLLVLISLLVAYFFLSLPDVTYLKTKNPKTTAFIELRKKQARKKKKNLRIHYQWISYNRFPEILKHAVRVSEDTGFFQHNGIDFYELREAIKKNQEAGKKIRGGSTITMQLAKNLYLSPRKTYLRKIREMFIARKLEKALSKKRIFSLYLNVIELGDGIFGFGAAALLFFHKPVDELNLIEIIRLVSVLPRPLKTSPIAKSNYLNWRANLLLDRLFQYKLITQPDYMWAKTTFDNL